MEKGFKNYIIKEFYNAFNMIDLSKEDVERQKKDDEDFPFKKTCEQLLKDEKNGDLDPQSKSRLNVCKLRNYLQYVTAAN